MSITRVLWIVLAVTGAVLSTAFLFRLRFRLRHRSIHRSDGDGWQRGGPALLGFALSLLATGVGTGAALTWQPSPGDRAVMPWSSMVEIGPEPIPEEMIPDATRPDASPSSGPEPAEPEAEAQPGERASASPPGPDAALQDVRPSVTAISPAGRFGVRVGVFRSVSNARDLVVVLRAREFDPLVVERSTNAGDPLYYVYAGAFDTRDEAEEAAAAVRALGVETLVVEMATLPPG